MNTKRVSQVNKESVWDYPKTPRVEPVKEQLKIIFYGLTIASSERVKRVLQWGIPPSYYVPLADIKMQYLHKTQHRSYCQHKGFAEYWTVRVKDREAKNAAWSYPKTPGHLTPKGHVAFYAHLMDMCLLGEEQASAPPWVWLGGWVTRGIEGPFLTKDQCEQNYKKAEL